VWHFFSKRDEDMGSDYFKVSAFEQSSISVKLLEERNEDTSGAENADCSIWVIEN